MKPGDTYYSIAWIEPPKGFGIEITALVIDGVHIPPDEWESYIEVDGERIVTKIFERT